MNRFENLPTRQRIVVVSLFAVFILGLCMVFLEMVSLGALVTYRAAFTDESVSIGWVRQIGFFYRAPGKGSDGLSEFAIPDPYLGYRIRPSVRIDAVDPITGENIGYPQVNKYGFVKNNDDVSDEEAIDPEDFIIVVTGGSTAVGLTAGVMFTTSWNNTTRPPRTTTRL